MRFSRAAIGAASAGERVQYAVRLQRPHAPHRACAAIASCTLLVLLLLLPSLHAQTLNLGPPTKPALPEHTFLTDLEARLTEQIDGHTRHLESARDAGDGDWVLASSVSIATRALARRLLQPDATLPAAGAIRIVDGVTIAELAPSVDDLAHRYVDLAFQTRGSAPDDPDSIDAAARAEQARAALGAFLRAATTDPASPQSVRSIPSTVLPLDRALLGVFDELRPAIEAITNDAAEIEPAWPPPPDAPPVDAAAVEAARGALDELAPPEPGRARVAQALDELARAERLPIYRRSARLMATTIEQTLRAAATIAEADWLDDRRTESIALGVEAAGDLVDRTTRTDAEPTADVLRRLGGLVTVIDGLEARKVLASPARRAVNLLLQSALPPDESARRPAKRLSRETLDDALGAVERILGTVAARPTLKPDHFKNAMLRRAWRLMERDYERAERRTLEILPDLAADPKLLTTPDVISQLKSHRDACEDLRRVAAVPVWERQLRGKKPEPGTSGTDDNGLVETSAIDQSIRSGAADRLNALADAFSRDRVRERVLVELAKFERAWTDYAELPGEAMLRRCDPSATAVTGGRCAEVLAAMRRDRREWLVAWAAWRLDDVGAALELLARHARVGKAIEACVLLSDPARLEAIDRWAPVALRDGVGAVRRDAKVRVAAMIDALLAGDWDAVDRALESWDEQASTAVLLARLARATNRPDWPREEGVRGLVARLGSGAPDWAWCAGQRRGLAEISRWMRELGRADAGGGEAEDGGDELAEDILEYLNGLSRRVLGAMDAR